LLNRHFTEKNKAESGQTTEKGHLFWTHHLSLLGHLLDLVDELPLLVLQALPLPFNIPDGLLQHPLILPQQLGWGLLLAEDEAHGDRRAGRKSGDEWLASSDPATAMRDGSSWSSAGGIGKSSPIGVGALPFVGIAGVDSWPRL